MENQKKILTRIQLVNWHNFENERISLNGSALISGENTAGKSTILDAIQLVLTTNSRKFNMAANEKSNRDLRGYVRCKIGVVGETYLRKNVVPANVALEFYEEKGDRYFIIGVHLLSQDEESPVIRKWYVLDKCRLEDLSFMADGRRPALADEFRMNGKKIRYIETDRAARDYFKHRLGNLDDKFFDIIPKSLAFKPMDNVKEFINKFVLSEAKIDIATLRENIETLSELELLLERSRKQYAALAEIVQIHESIMAKEHDLCVNDILLTIAGKDALQQEIADAQADVRLKELAAESADAECSRMQEQEDEVSRQIIDINVAINSNSSSQMIENLTRQKNEILKNIGEQQKQKQRLQSELDALKVYAGLVHKLSCELVVPEELHILADAREQSQKTAILEKIERFQDTQLEELRSASLGYKRQMEDLSAEITQLQEHLRKLEKRKLTYPDNTTKLKKMIEEEFAKRRITSSVYILSELLEITDLHWANAVEGYLDQQKFYLVVEPEYYDLALEVYEKNHKSIHSAGIINTKKVPVNDAVDNRSLAYVVTSENRYAKAYANYLLGRVMRCDTGKELEQYDIAITAECMLYQGYVVRRINPKRYRNPFIGQNAYRVQIENTKKELEQKSGLRKELREILQRYTAVLEAEKKFHPEILKMTAPAPLRIKKEQELLAKTEEELQRASKDPSLIELQIQLEEKEREQKELKKKLKDLRDEVARLGFLTQQTKERIRMSQEQFETESQSLSEKEDADGAAYQEALEKYRMNRKTKSARKVADNFAPQRSQFENEKEKLVDALKDRQRDFNTEFTQDFVVGLTGMAEYREQMSKLRTIEMIRYEEKLADAKADCENIFRSDFLSKMKELIENARTEFRSLNKALDQIYYGDDSYRFKISFDKHKEGLYRMITSENNQEGINLWTAAFEEQYHDEMVELFEKLMTKDDKGQKIVEEYTDYRSYLDYDIEIHKRDGSVQRFSDIYGEKSGSETQVPYYVAIAASFYQLYRFGNSVRIMLLDEAFDKMDDERIGSMMDFFNGLDLQVIMATPPSKIEIIGEKVGTVLTAIRAGVSSIVEEYDL